MQRYDFSYENMGYLHIGYHENLEIDLPRHWGGPIAVPYYGYRLRHQGQNGPIKELKDFTVEELRQLGEKYGFDTGV